ncbi:MAG TPA: hypothetical protein PLP17_06175 [Oligoflexia bacterium]|nr:hypothetical protein [Oligoflexia bacterium]
MVNHTEINPEDRQAQAASALPTIRDYMRTYGASLEGNDLKAVKVFRDYESHERLRRLQGELILVKNDKVPEETCDAIIGKKRRSKYQTYAAWASLMLQWISAPGKK